MKNETPRLGGGAEEPLVFERIAGAFYFFAYGSLMNEALLRTRGVRPEVESLARLPDHELGFFGHSRVWDGAQETVVRSPGRCVHGVVYRLAFGDGETLDAWQDVRLDGTGTYFHYPARVVSPSGRSYTVLLYRKDIQGEARLPSTEYRDFIVQGARSRGLPPEYVATLEGLPSSKAGFAVPKPSRFNSALLGCSECGDLRDSVEFKAVEKRKTSPAIVLS